MSVKANTVVVAASVAWEQENTNDGGSFANTKQGPDSIAFRLAVNTTTFNDILISKLSIAANTSNTVDVYSFTSKVYQSVTATKLRGLIYKATGTAGGSVAVTPGSVNPLTWPFGNSTYSFTLNTNNSEGAVVVLMDGTTVTVSNTARNLTFTNAGNQTVTVLLAGIVGT